MNRICRNCLAIALLMMFLCLIPGYVSYAKTRATDVKTASDGNEIVIVHGVFEKAKAASVKNMINKYRREACNNGYPDPRNIRRKLTKNDYKPINWAGDLEWIAQTRAAEASVFQSHTRPSGKSNFTCTHRGIKSQGESIAWNHSGLNDGVKLWYKEKNGWIKKKKGNYGHYALMINPDVRMVGIGCFSPASNDYICVAAEFSFDQGLSTGQQGVNGDWDQKLEVKEKKISKGSISGKNSVSCMKKTNYTIERFLTFPHINGGNLKTPVKVNENEWSWSVSDDKIAKISQKGKLTGLKEGKVTIYARRENGNSVSKRVKVKSYAEGYEFWVGKIKYRIDEQGKEVKLLKIASASGTIVLPDGVTYKGHRYKVTSVAKYAFKNNKKIKAVRFGKHIYKIGKEAFYGCSGIKTIIITPKIRYIRRRAFCRCSSLERLIIRSRKLKKKDVGNRSFMNTRIRVVLCPAGMKKAYKKWLLKKGISKKAVIK